jgi:hypothetical protein
MKVIGVYLSTTTTHLYAKSKLSKRTSWSNILFIRWKGVYCPGVDKELGWAAFLVPETSDNNGIPATSNTQNIPDETNFLKQLSTDAIFTRLTGFGSLGSVGGIDSMNQSLRNHLEYF